MRTLALLSSWPELRTRTALCVPPKETFVYAVIANSVLHAVDVITNSRTWIAQLEGFGANNMYIDCNSKVLLATDSKVLQVYRRGTYARMHTIQTFFMLGVVHFAFVDDEHVFSRYAGEERFGYVRHIDDCTPERFQSKAGTRLPTTSQVCVDRGNGLVTVWDGILRRFEFDGRHWKVGLRFGRTSYSLCQARAISYACDHVVAFTVSGIFTKVPTHEMRCAWIALCCVPR